MYNNCCQQIYIFDTFYDRDEELAVVTHLILYTVTIAVPPASLDTLHKTNKLKYLDIINNKYKNAV